MVEKKKKNEKEIIETKNSFSSLEVIILVIITVIVSFGLGSFITYNLNVKSGKKTNKYTDKITKYYHYIIDNYYEDVDKEKLANGAINGMLSSLDDEYSYVLGDDDADNFDIELEGEYQGIGVEIIINNDNEIVIYNIFTKSPADKAGLKVGDIIKEVDGKEYDDSSKIANYIRNEAGNEIKMKVIRDKEEKEFTIKKDSVTIDSVISKTFTKKKKKIGYIYISIFSNSTTKQFKEKLQKLEKDDIDALIIDVRDNSGGHLTTATKIISMFLDSSHIIYQTDTKGKIEKFYSNGKNTKKYPIAILQNSNSASASEMLSAALKEEYGAIVVGETSYGKGTVQELTDIGKDTELKITTKKWLTPKGNSINKKGVAVDFEIKLSDEYKKDPSDDNDNQLQKAIEEIAKK